MTAPRCSRCGDPFELRQPDDIRCRPCQVEVDRLIAEDTARRERKVFEVPKDLTGLRGIVL